jgi:GTP-binding protein HflX
VLISDTVGFIRKLPHHLVEAFRSTLEEVAEADLLLHVVDATAVDVEAQVAAVRSVLREIGAGDVPELIAVNKSDASDMAAVIARRYDAIPISAATGEGIDDLLATLADRLRRLTDVVELLVPYDRGDVLASLHREGEVLEIDHTEEGIRVLARLEPASVGVLRPFVLAGLDDEAEETV